MLVLAVAQLLSIAGDRIHYLALVSMLTRGEAPAASLVWLGQAMLIPALLFSPFVGPLVDRWRLVAVLVVADAARALVVALMPQAFEAAGVSALLALVFAGFTLNCFFLPARSALPPKLVAPGDLLSANALLTLCGVAATVFGSGFGGKIVDAIGWRGALYLDAATFGLSALLLVFLWPATRERTKHRRLRARRYFRSVIAGLVFLLRSKAARRALLASIGLWVGGGFLFVAGALHAQDAPGRVGSLGILMALFGGGLAASAGWAMTRRELSPRWALGGGLLGAAVGLGLFAATRSFAVMGAGALVTGICVGPLLASAETELQRAAGDRRRGRVFAGRDFASRLGFLLAIAAAGGIVHSAGPAAALALGSGVLVVMGIAALRLRSTAFVALLALGGLSCSATESRLSFFGDESPSWSPDGRLIAFSHFTIDGNEGLYVVPAEGGRPRLVHRGIILTPEWSPDSRRIVFEEVGLGLGIVSASGGTPSYLGGGQNPSWSTHDRIVFEGFGSIETIRPDGSDRVTLPVQASDPDWAPDGNRLVVSRYGPISDANIAIVDTAGQLLKLLTRNGGLASFPVWSANGAKIAWEYYPRGSPRSASRPRIAVVDTSDRSEPGLIVGGRFAIDPTGRYLCSRLSTSSGNRLFVFRTGGSFVRQLTR